MTMTEAVKFTFDQSFDTDDNTGNGDPDDFYFGNEPKFGDTDMAAARAEAHAKGVADGQEQARESYEAQMSACLEKIGSAASTMLQERRLLAEELRQEAALLAHLVASRLADRLMADHPLAEIEGVISDCLAERHAEIRVVVRVSPDQHEYIKGRIDDLASKSGFGGDVVMIEDATIGNGDCRIEWADGGAERSQAALSAITRGAIDRYLNIVASRSGVGVPAAEPEREPAPESAAGTGTTADTVSPATETVAASEAGAEQITEDDDSNPETIG